MKISYNNCTCTEGKDYKGGDPGNAQWVACGECNYWEVIEDRAAHRERYEASVKTYIERTREYHRYMASNGVITEEPNDCLVLEKK